MQVLCQGFFIVGCGLIEMIEVVLEDKCNVVVIECYQVNILCVVLELKYYLVCEFVIDLVLFINGLLVVIVELKIDFIQFCEVVMDQYCNDCLLYDVKIKCWELLLIFKCGVVVYFVMFDFEIMMVIKLDGENIFFLLFNKGCKDESGMVYVGNLSGEIKVDGIQEYLVVYFWEVVCQLDVWLWIFYSFVYVEKKDVVDIQGNWLKKEILIFLCFY